MWGVGGAGRILEARQSRQSRGSGGWRSRECPFSHGGGPGGPGDLLARPGPARARARAWAPLCGGEHQISYRPGCAACPSGNGLGALDPHPPTCCPGGTRGHKSALTKLRGARAGRRSTFRNQGPQALVRGTGRAERRAWRGHSSPQVTSGSCLGRRTCRGAGGRRARGGSAMLQLSAGKKPGAPGEAGHSRGRENKGDRQPDAVMEKPTGAPGRGRQEGGGARGTA